MSAIESRNAVLGRFRVQAAPPGQVRESLSAGARLSPTDSPVRRYEFLFQRRFVLLRRYLSVRIENPQRSQDAAACARFACRLAQIPGTASQPPCVPRAL